MPHHSTPSFLTPTGKSQPPLPRSPPPVQLKHLPPPPPISVDAHKHRSKHREHPPTNHKPPHNDTYSQPQKHSLPQDSAQKHKRLKTEPHPQSNSAPGQTSSKQQMSLNTYRQNKRQAAPLMDGSMDGKVRRVHQDPQSLSSLPSLSNHINSSSHGMPRVSSHSNSNNHGSLPPLPPLPLPRSQASVSPPPPPPPPN